MASAKASQKYVAGKLKLVQKCRNANLKDGSCPAPDVDAVAKLDAKRTSAIAKACPLINTDFDLMGFPGPCTDANPADGFTLSDLQACMATSHDAFITAALDLEYDATVMGPLGAADLKCQAEVAKQSGAFAVCLLKNVSKCRDAILKGQADRYPVRLLRHQLPEGQHRDPKVQSQADGRNREEVHRHPDFQLEDLHARPDRQSGRRYLPDQ